MKKTFCFLLLLLVLSACNDKYTSYNVEEIHRKQIPVNDSIKTTPEIDNYIAPYKENVEKQLSTILSYNKNTMFKSDGDLNSAIGNMMADYVFEETNALLQKRSGQQLDMVLLNYGGIRAGMTEGAVTLQTAFEIMPFENEIVVLELSFEQMQQMLVYLQKAKTAHPVSGVTIEFDKNYQLQNFLIQGEKLHPEKTYFIATSDYLKDGGDGMNFFEGALQEIAMDYKIRNLLIDHFRKTDTIAYKADGRFIRNQLQN